MKLITYVCIVLCSIIFMGFSKVNPLSNTSWNGLLNVPDPVEATLKFSQDTMYVYIETQLIETSLYSVEADTIKVTKSSGNSPCGDETGTYTYKINDDILIITPVSDICDARYEAFTALGYEKKE